MNCQCMTHIDEKLKEKNLHLTGYAFVFATDGPMDLVPTVQTSWLDREKAPKGKKNAPTQMFASHCPFCGEPVDDKKHAEGKREDKVAERMRLELAMALGWDGSNDVKLPEWKELLTQVSGLQGKVNCFNYLADHTKPIRYSVKSDNSCVVTSPVAGTAKDLQQAVEWCMHWVREEQEREARRAGK